MIKLSINKMLFIALFGTAVSMIIFCKKQEEAPMKRKMTRNIEHNGILDVIVERESKRAMSGEEISDEQLMRIFEAARWAPSSFNEQPWRFLYAKRNSKQWDTFFNLMVPFNQSWAKDAAVLVLIVSKDTFTKNNNPNSAHSFDAGAAWQNMALQGTNEGLVVHGMSGIDYEKARTDLRIPEGYTIEAMVAIGKPGPIDNLPETLRSKELESSDRKKVKEFVIEGAWKPSIK